jgi:S-formylglutathione hydrolase
MERVEARASFGGRQEVWAHDSEAVHCRMKFGIYLPPAVLAGKKRPVLYWLSGLTCTEQNFITKSAVQEHAARHQLIVVAPDTSPRGEDVADDPAYDLGQGAGFYVDATQAPWAAHYRMQRYVGEELPALVESHFAATDARGISGHSMGGHGALVTAMRHRGRYRSVSAFAPIVAPSSVPWGEKAFGAYLGAGRAQGLHLLVDQGTGDEFLDSQLQPQRLKQACDAAGVACTLRLQPGYDHSYYFIASFIGEHVAHHAAALDV